MSGMSHTISSCHTKSKNPFTVLHRLILQRHLLNLERVKNYQSSLMSQVWENHDLPSKTEQVRVTTESLTQITYKALFSERDSL